MTTNAMKTQHRTRAALPLEGKRTLRRSPLVPHLAFWSVGLLAKVVCPVSLKWLAYDSITTLLLSVWYPLCATIALIHREEKNRSSDVRYIEGLQIERQFWIEYWSVGFAGVQFLQQLVSLVPPLQQMGRYDYPNLPVVLNEIKLLFFVWIFVMEPLLECYQRSLGVGGSWKKFAPLAFLTQAVGPRLMRVQTAVSEQISRDTWQRVIQRKAQRVLELMVVMQFLEEESMAYLLQLLEEGRSLLLLSVFMVLPSSICQVGMLYAQFLFPSARSLAARGNPMEVLSLKYWVLNSILTLFLSATWWLWWCIPFSSQLILGIRCFATFPSTIAHHYSAVEMELITFGILKGEPKLTVKETRTVQALRAVVKRLPRDKQAQSFQFEIDIDSDSEGKSNDGDSSVGSVETTESEDERRRKHRREKRAKKRLLKEKKLGSSNTRRPPPPLLSESFIAQYDDENDHNEQRNNGFIDNDEKYSSFINSNKNCEDKSDNNVIDLTQYGEYSTEKEERDARNAAAKDSATRAEIGYTTSAESNSSLPSCYSSIATPTENIIGEVEVQVRSTTRRLESNENETSFAPLFPVTHPKSSGSNSIMQAASSDESLSLSKAPQSSNDELSEIDLNGRNEINESCESWNSSHEESTDGKKTTNVDDEIISSPRRSSRLIQLREWQERKREEEESKKAKKSKLSKKPRPEGSREKVPEKSLKSSVKKPKKSTSDKEKKKATASSPKKSSKKSKTTTTPSKQSAEASVKSKITKQSSPASSPEKTTKDSKKKGARSLEPDVEGSRSSTSSPQKTPKSKPKKVPNSSKKKKKKETSGLGGLLSRK